MSRIGFWWAIVKLSVVAQVIAILAVPDFVYLKVNIK